MKKVILILVALVLSLSFGGCRATPSVASSIAQMYETTKTVWVKGQEVVIINSDLLSDNTLKHLSRLDESANKIDTVKNIVTATDDEKYKMLEAEYSKIQEYFDTHEIGIRDSSMILRHEEISDMLDAYDRIQMTKEILTK